MKSGSPSRTTAAHTKHKIKPRPGPLSSSNVVTPPFIPSEAPPWDSRPVSGAGVVHYHSLHRPRSVPTALGPAPLVTIRFQIFMLSSSTWVILVTLLRLLCVVFDVSTFGHPFICILCGLTEMDHFSKNLYLCLSEERVIYMCGNFIFGWSIALRCHTYINYIYI